MNTASDTLVNVLINWGVDVVFGLPGDGINGLMEAFRKAKDKIKFVHVRHEEAAAFMACSYSKFTGRLGVCIATSGPGGIHLLNGLYDAKMDGQSVLAITGNTFHDLMNTFGQQDVQLDKLFDDVAEYSVRIMGPAHVENAVNLACRTAISKSCVAHVTIAKDFQEMEAKASSSNRNAPHHVSDVLARKAGQPMTADIMKAAEILNQGNKIAILAGRGALKATEELEQTAEKLGAPIIKPLLGKASVPDDSPYTTGSIGLLGTKPSQEAMEECDTLLIVGTSFPYMEFYPEPGKVKAVQIDTDPQRIGLRYPVEAGLVGDAKVTLQLLLPSLQKKSDRSFLEKAQEGMKEWWSLMEERGTRTDKPMKPQVVSWELGRLLKDDAIVISDSGTIATWWARQIKAKRNQMFSLSGNLATMANGFPYAIGAQVAYPERQVVAFVGDGGFTMLMGELSTCIKYNLPVKIIIIKNNTLGQIKWEQMVLDGNPEYGCEFEPIDFVKFAESCGVKGFRIDNPKQCGSTLEEALNYKGPAVIEALVDQFEPPLPPKITVKQAKKFAKSLIKGEPNRERIALTITSDKVRELI
ncbi:MAG: thiamine pyrophosphate-dependent enzyme [Ignavibacteriaceae bacterium]